MRKLIRSDFSLVVILAITIAVGMLVFAATQAFAEGGGKGPDTRKVNVIMALDLRYGLVQTSTQLFAEKGPMDCSVRCGKIVAHFGSDEKFESASVKLKPYERVVGASYYYSSNDGSGYFDGKNNWSGKGVLPAEKMGADAQGVSHKLYLTSAYVQALNRKFFVMRRGLVPAN